MNLMTRFYGLTDKASATVQRFGSRCGSAGHLKDRPGQLRDGSRQMWHRPGAEPLHDETSRLGGVGGYVAVDVSAEFVAGAHMADRIGGIAQVNRLGTE
ncbi:Uncharacterised protein [Mycobacterium tuberculosis]|nr:Uncharacterised protein [Mycobacterium tuberculosis]CKZ27830.1 Uncharacterised protein [Mycobacterium tuberculosis]CPA41793.1 Uncharacterised protein [Mycobacterium tuberculosis]